MVCSKRRIIFSLIILVIMSWGLTGLLIINLDKLTNHLHLYEDEIERLQGMISELKGKMLENLTIKIGVTAACDRDYERTRRFFKEIIEKDVNEYCSKINHGVKFDFIIKNNNGTGGQALENLYELKNLGINIIIGHPWSSQCYVSMSYINENNMLLFSSSASSYQLARSDDNFLRLSPDDMAQARVIAEMLRSRGINAIIVLYIDYEWGVKLFNKLVNEFSKYGGVVEKAIPISRPWEANITNCLYEAEASAREAVTRYGSKSIAVQLIGAGESALREIVRQAKDYPTLYDLYWFGSHFAAKNKGFIEEAPEESSHLKIFSPLPTVKESPLYSMLNERYYTLFAEPLDLDMASRYDIAFIIAEAILEARTTDVGKLLEVIPEIASKTFGASGWCKLDENGDREMSDYEIWGYGYIDGRVDYIKYGLYDGLRGKIFWYKDNPSRLTSPN
ncbi:MAG: ABC transporter substrate-binding protein [Candidatus Bathyarchaeia archaeon]